MQMVPLGCLALHKKSFRRPYFKKGHVPLDYKRNKVRITSFVVKDYSLPSSPPSLQDNLNLLLTEEEMYSLMETFKQCKIIPGELMNQD